MEMIKYCECGCGKLSPIAKRANPYFGWIKGRPLRFVRGHNTRKPEKYKTENGRSWSIKISEHPRANKAGYVYEHILVAEKTLSKSLSPAAVVHHVDENPLNNINSNLVICENNGYHLILHRRRRAYQFCGHAHWRQCKYCHKYDDPENLTIRSGHGGWAYHKKCANFYQRDLIKGGK